jgi:hypothetical protein
LTCTLAVQAARIETLETELACLKKAVFDLAYAQARTPGPPPPPLPLPVYGPEPPPETELGKLILPRDTTREMLRELDLEPKDLYKRAETYRRTEDDPPPSPCMSIKGWTFKEITGCVITNPKVCLTPEERETWGFDEADQELLSPRGVEPRIPYAELYGADEPLFDWRPTRTGTETES